MAVFVVIVIYRILSLQIKETCFQEIFPWSTPRPPPRWTYETLTNQKLGLQFTVIYIVTVVFKAPLAKWKLHNCQIKHLNRLNFRPERPATRVSCRVDTVQRIQCVTKTRTCVCQLSRFLRVCVFLLRRGSFAFVSAQFGIVSVRVPVQLFNVWKRFNSDLNTHVFL